MSKQFDLSSGFLPAKDPIKHLNAEWQVLDQIGYELPKLLVSDQLAATIQNLPLLSLTHLATVEMLERAMLLYSYISHAYIWAQPTVPKSLPANIAIPWHALAKKLRRPPVLSYASYALNNWRRLDVAKPIELGNIVLLQNFLGGIDEEWFVLVHIDIEAKAIPGLKAIVAAKEALNQKNSEQVQVNLELMRNTLRNLCNTLNRMPEHCDPYIYFNRVRPYIHGWENNPALPDGLIYEGVTEYQETPQKFKGETGAQSSIIPAFDAIFGIKHADNPLKMHLLDMRRYMPPSHRAFLEYLDQGDSIRDFLLVNKKLTDCCEIYNDCIRLVGEFRLTHIRYAAQYIQKQSQDALQNPNTVGTGGTPFMEYLQKHRHETEQFLL